MIEYEEAIKKAKLIINNHREIDRMMVIEMAELIECLVNKIEKQDKEVEMEHKTACENAKSVLDIEKPYKEQMELLDYMSKRFEEAIIDIHLSNMFWAVMKKDNIDIKTLMEREMSGYYDSKIVEE